MPGNIPPWSSLFWSLCCWILWLSFDLHSLKFLVLKIYLNGQLTPWVGGAGMFNHNYLYYTCLTLSPTGGRGAIIAPPPPKPYRLYLLNGWPDYPGTFLTFKICQFCNFWRKTKFEKEGGTPPRAPLKRGPSKNDPPMTAYDPQFCLQKLLDTSK